MPNSFPEELVLLTVILWHLLVFYFLNLLKESTGKVSLIIPELKNLSSILLPISQAVLSYENKLYSTMICRACLV